MEDVKDENIPKIIPAYSKPNVTLTVTLDSMSKLPTVSPLDMEKVSPVAVEEPLPLLLVLTERSEVLSARSCGREIGLNTHTQTTLTKHIHSEPLNLELCGSGITQTWNKRLNKFYPQTWNKI